MIELNADIGEGYEDAALAPYVGRVSIACGGHAGDAASMTAALRLASEYGLVVGAHPSYPDRARFGRHRLPAAPEAIMSWLTQQVDVLAECAAGLGLRLAHVKPHGALYNVAAADVEVAQAVAAAVRAFDPGLQLVGLAGSQLIAEGRAAGLAVLSEAFADRRYEADGALVSRETGEALLTDPALAARQARALAQGHPVVTRQGGSLHLEADTLCLHGDTPNAVDIARAVHAAIHRG